MPTYKQQRMGRGSESAAERMARIEALARSTDQRPSSSKKLLDRGFKFTLASFGAIAGAMGLSKYLNPEVQLHGLIKMFALVFGGCMLMNFIVRRRR